MNVEHAAGLHCGGDSDGSVKGSATSGSRWHWLKQRTTKLHGSVVTENVAPGGLENASAEHFELRSDEEVALTWGMGPAPLSEVAGP